MKMVDVAAKLGKLAAKAVRIIAETKPAVKQAITTVESAAKAAKAAYVAEIKNAKEESDVHV